MQEHNVDRLDTQIKELHATLHILSDDDLWLELIKLLRQPGWTTPAEFVLFDGITQAMHVHARALVEMKQVLLEGSRAIVEAGVERAS